MPIELSMLLWSAILCFLLVAPYATASIPKYGLARLAGDRTEPLPQDGWIGRARRAHANHVENLGPFAAFILVAHAVGGFDAMTALGSQIFFWSRLVHAVCYIAGVPWVRTVAFLVGATGELMILWGILA